MMLIRILIFLLTVSSRAKSDIQTVPNLTNNVFAYGFDNLTLKVKFEKEKEYFACEWVIRNKTNEELGVDSRFIINVDGSCNEPPLCVEEEGDEGVTFITSQLTISNPIVYDVYADVACNPSIVITSWIGFTMNCSNSTDFGVSVISDSTQYKSNGLFMCSDDEVLAYSSGTKPTTPDTVCLYSASWENEDDLKCFAVCQKNLVDNVTVETNTDLPFYKSSGKFSCPNEYELFYTDGTVATKKSTTCQENGTWERQHTVQCWTAPKVRIVGNLTVEEGKDLSITCNYTEVLPGGNCSLFFVNDSVFENITKDEAFLIPSISKKENSFSVYCQALTPFTKVYNETGRSDVGYLNILYSPYIKSRNVCDWDLNTKGICAITIDSNPAVATFVSLKKNGSRANFTDITNKTSSFTVIFIFIQNKVTIEDNGTYTLEVSIDENCQTSELNFTIIVDEFPTTTQSAPPLTSPPPSPALTIALSCVGGVLGIALIVTLLTCWKQKQGPPNQKDTSIENQSVFHKSKGEKQVGLSTNELYEPLDNKSNSQAKGIQGNELYVPLESQSKTNATVDLIEPMYSSPIEKNPIPNRKSSLKSTDTAKDVYASVKKPSSKSKEKKTSESQQNVKELYAQVNTRRKQKQVEKTTSNV